MRVVLIAGVFCVLLSACRGVSKTSKPVTSCTEAGPSCVIDEGKLGICVKQDESCTGAGCFVCQSQH
jgi:hypothetical protein